MRRRYKVLIGVPTFLAFLSFAINTHIPNPPTAAPCSDEWFFYIETDYFSTERGNVWSDPVRLDWTTEGDWRWFEYIEDKIGAHHPPATITMQQRCQLLQSHLQSRIYVFNDLLDNSISFPRNR
jgi:hypothetical protein